MFGEDWNYSQWSPGKLAISRQCQTQGGCITWSRSLRQGLEGAGIQGSSRVGVAPEDLFLGSSPIFQGVQFGCSRLRIATAVGKRSWNSPTVLKLRMSI